MIRGREKAKAQSKYEEDGEYSLRHPYPLVVCKGQPTLILSHVTKLNSQYIPVITPQPGDPTMTVPPPHGATRAATL